MHHISCPKESCEVYIGESGRRIVERIKDHGGRDNRSQEKSHTEVGSNELKIIIWRLHKEQIEKKMAGSLQ